MEARALEKLHADTGRTFDEWVALARKTRLRDETALRAWLRDEHGFRSRLGWWIASAALATELPDYEQPEQLVEALYSGRHLALRTLHEALVDEFLGLGGDVLVTSCKTMVPVYRKYVFAQLRPTPKGVELQLALAGEPASGRVKPTRRSAPGDRMTHLLVVSTASEIDAELKGLLRSAYAQGNEKSERAAGPGKAPAEFTAALKRSKPAAATWAQCTPAMQRDMLEWITSAKQEATRQKRLSTAIDKLAEGKRRVY